RRIGDSGPIVFALAEGMMFDAIASPMRSGRSARSIAFSIAMHTVVVGAAVAVAWLSAHDSPLSVVDVPLRPFRPEKPPATISGDRPQKPRTARAKPSRPAPPVVEPKEIPQSLEEPPPALEETEVQEVGGDGTEVGTDVAGVTPGVSGGSDFGAPEAM